MTKEKGKNGEGKSAAIEDFVRHSIMKPMRSVVRRERKEIERLIRGLRLAVGMDLDVMMRELRSRSIQTESALAAKLGEIEASLNLIAAELARRADDQPPGSRGS